MATDYLQKIEALFTSVRNLSSDNDYKAVATAFDEITSLKKQMNSKEKEIQDLRKEAVDLKARYENRIEEGLELYRTKHNKLEGEKVKLSEEISTLRATIQQKEKSAAELNEAQKKLQGQFDSSNKSLQQEKDRVISANKAVIDLQHDLKSKDAEIDKLKGHVRNERTKVSNVENQLLALKKENTALQLKLESSTTRLREVEGFGTELRELGDSAWTSQWDKIWESARQTVQAHLNRDLPEDKLEDLVKSLRGSSVMDRPIPLPRSNSPAAKRMRISAMLAILAKHMDQDIFQPTYLLDEDEEIRLILIRLALKDSKKEAFFRALLLSIDPPGQAKRASKRVEQVVREVAWHVRDLLPGTQYDSFRDGLEKVVNQACDFWRAVQRAPEKFEPYFDLNHHQDVQWQPLAFDDGGQGAVKAPVAADEGLMVVFPRVYILEDEEPEPITSGVVLTKSQTAAAAEEEDAERRKPSSPVLGKAMPRPRANKARNKSITLNGAGDFLSQAAQSGAH